MSPIAIFYISFDPAPDRFPVYVPGARVAFIRAGSVESPPLGLTTAMDIADKEFPIRDGESLMNWHEVPAS